MLRADRSIEAPGKDSNEGTSARTRPFSFEEIMLRREKKLAADSKESARELGESSEKNDAIGDSDRSNSDDGYKTKILREMQKVSSKKMEEVNFKRERDHLGGKDKGNHDSETKTKVKFNHRKSSRDKENSKSSRDKESKTEKLSYHRRSTGDRLGGDSEKQPERKRPKESVEKDKHWERERKPREEKRKHPSRIDEKYRSEIYDTYSRKHDSVRLRGTEYSERKDRKKERSQPYSEELKSKRRRSRSLEYERERERDRRSISVSPRAQKRSYHGHDYGESSFQSYKDKSRREYSDADKHRAENGGYDSGHHRKQWSGLGGYSPRKRKTEAAVRTPSPTVRSPERKSATWDQPPVGASHAGSGSMIANFQSPSTKMHDLVSSISVTPAVTKPLPAPSIDTVSTVLNASVDSVQLTQATRPMRRLYIEHLPPSAADKTVVDCLNEFLLSSGGNHIQRTNPCISCLINKEKRQALVEFLTPEDATTALSFDGRSLFGSVVKIRRPKDFVEASSEVPEKSVSVAEAISDAVKDSPNKVFIGGISKALSSEMLMEIVSAFGLLRAYHFEFNEDFNESFAFLEYADHSVTLKACSGLNGMKLGGHVLTAVQALPDADGGEESTDAAPSYGIPMHAKPLLADPTQILQIKNVFDRETFLLLSEPELEESLEDVRLECVRFGTVKSVNLVRHNSDCEAAAEALDKDIIVDSSKMKAGVESSNHDFKQNGGPPPSDDTEDLRNFSEVAEDTNGDDAQPVKDLEQKESIDPFPVGAATVCGESMHLGAPSGEPPTGVDKAADVKVESPVMERSLVSDSPELEAGTESTEIGDSVVGAPDRAVVSNGDDEHTTVEPKSSDITGADEASISNGDGDHRAFDLDVFEPGCILVEFVRAEAACMAAHCLHGRAYGEQIVSVGYVAHNLYLARFPR